ncbi:MAG TPA: EF-hand domain-containing protein [Ensifer sp.]|nr:EF-hand domain-containing protein [Ensifer sp.]
MTTIQSSQSGSAYSNALAKLLERMQSANDTQSSTSTTAGSTASTSTTTTPSLASVLAADNDDDDTSSTSSQTSSAIAAMMMDIQQLKSSSSTSSGTSSADGGPPSISDVFAKSDTDGNGSLSQSEFVASRPDGMSEDDAKSMFNAIDSSGTGSVTEDQLESYMEKNKPVGGHHHHGSGAEDASKAFSKIDSDSSGSVSLSEFVAGRPKGMSEEDATTMFKSIDTEGTGSISEEQFAAKLKEQRATDGTSDSNSPSDMAALAKDLMKQLTQVIQSFNNGYVDTSTATASATSASSTTVD